MARHGSPPNVCPELVRALADADTEDIEKMLASRRATANGLARRLNDARREVEAMEIELRRRGNAG